MIDISPTITLRSWVISSSLYLRNIPPSAVKRRVAEPDLFGSSKKFGDGFEKFLTLESETPFRTGRHALVGKEVCRESLNSRSAVVSKQSAAVSGSGDNDQNIPTMLLAVHETDCLPIRDAI